LRQLLELSVLVQPGTFDPGQLGIDENEFGADWLQDSDEFSVGVPSSSAPLRGPEAQGGFAPIG
jgi:hypothetical protein